VTERDWVDAHLVNVALDIHDDDPAFGYRFIADELPEKGIKAGENRVQRLCRDHGIWSVFSKKRGGDGKDGWENSRQSNMKQSTEPRSQRPKTPSQEKPGQSLSIHSNLALGPDHIQ
jgi:hypothetical protein